MASTTPVHSQQCCSRLYQAGAEAVNFVAHQLQALGSGLWAVAQRVGSTTRSVLASIASRAGDAWEGARSLTSRGWTFVSTRFMENPRLYAGGFGLLVAAFGAGYYLAAANARPIQPGTVAAPSQV